MSKHWTDSTIDPSRLRSVRLPPMTWRDIPLVEPKRVEVGGVRWVAVRTAPQCERSVALELEELGFSAYCPLGATFVFWANGRKGKNKLIKQHPVFRSYVFGGIPPGRMIGRSTSRKIVSVISDSLGPLAIPASAIRAINDLELAKHWDQTTSWREKSPFQPGSQILIQEGPFRGYYATVDELTSESRIRALVEIFGRETPMDLDTAFVEAV